MKLRALEPEDLELLYTIENDTDMWDVGTIDVPYSRYTLRNYIATQQNDIFADRQLRLVITDEEGRGVGLIDLFNYSPENDRAEIGIALLKECRGKGYAKEAIIQLLDYAHYTLHIHQIIAIVPMDNLASKIMLERTGFSKSVVLKDWLKTVNGYADAELFQNIMA